MTATATDSTGHPAGCEAGFVMDAPALLAYLRGDEGGAVVQRVLQQCRDCESRVDIAAWDLLETYAVSAREAPSLLEELVSLVDQLPLYVHPVTQETAAAVAELVAAHPEVKPSQALALTLAGRNDSTLVTGDPELSPRPNCLYVGPRGGNPGG